MKTGPRPRHGERPSEFAGRLAEWLTDNASDPSRTTYGQYFTPRRIAQVMAGTINVEGDRLRILDPGAGTGVLACALAEHIAEMKHGDGFCIEIVAYEIDKAAQPLLIRALRYVTSWLRDYGIEIRTEVRTHDFVIDAAQAVNPQKTFTEMTERQALGSFDAVICNPPYFKIPRHDPRCAAAPRNLGGQSNMYSLFMSLSAQLLSDDGQLVFIVPRSFTSGAYFRTFRKSFLSTIQPTHIHLFDSRRDAFRSGDVLQENIIIAGKRRGAEPGPVKITVSRGIEDIDRHEEISVTESAIIGACGDSTIIKIPQDANDLAVLHLVERWNGSLAAYGLRVSTGPVVAFRARHHLRQSRLEPGAAAPLLWLQNVRPMEITWPLPKSRKEQYIDVGAGDLLVRDDNYVLIRRFSAKEDPRRIIAAPLLQGTLDSNIVGFENHLNYIHNGTHGISRDDALGLAAILNNPLVDQYFRIVNGNTQVSATELRGFPLPSRATIREIGARVRNAASVDEISRLTEGLIEHDS